ncbi:MAG: phosphotransferase [Deltaproteobacteria bacterium]|nr:phosphotransferase [Candidatus Tharpella aukensis]
MSQIYTLPDELNNLIFRFLKQHLPGGETPNFQVSPLTPDGSDRLYYRISCPGNESFIAVNAQGTGQKIQPSGLSQNRSFILIRNHLANLDFPVPELLSQDQQNPSDDFYLLQDLGDTTLYQAIKTEGWKPQAVELYKKTISLLLRVQKVAAENFDPAWCYAGAYYDQQLIIENELNYFLKAFVMGHCGLQVLSETQHQLQSEFREIATAAMAAPANFFLFRDFQSKNLMLKEEQIFLIDFQGARIGPYYYDLAALINDPYTDIPRPLREQLLTDYFNKLAAILKTDAPDRETFNYFFALFSLIRTLQTLGAFGYLIGCRKTHFKEYIQPALKNLRHYLNKLSPHLDLPTLTMLTEKIGGLPKG